MTFFYDLNKRLADLAKKQDANQITESAVAAESKFSKLAKEIDKNPKVRNPEAVAAAIGRKKYGQKAMTAKSVAGRADESYEEMDEIAHDTGKKLLSKGERSSLAKQARAGKDIGKPGKMFKKVAADAAKRYGSKAAGERVAAAAMFKGAAKHESAGMTDEGNAFSGAVAKAKADGIQKGETIKVGGKTYPVKETAKKRITQEADPISLEEMLTDEGNEFTDARLSAIKSGKQSFTVGGKTYRVTGDTSDEKQMDEGYAEMDAWLKSREKEKGTGRFDKKKISTGTVYTRKPETFDDPETEPEATGGAPKRKGRPAGTKRAIGAKHSGTSKLARKAAIAECDPEEYDQEGDMAKDNLETMVMAAKELHSILGDNDNLPEWVQAKITKALDYINASNDYIQSEKRDAYDDEEVAEVAPPGAKAERMVKHIKKGYSKDGKLTPKEKAIAYATTWKAHNAGKVEEESTDKEDTKAERAGKKVTKDIEYDEKHTGKDDAKAEKAGKKVTKDIEYDDKKDKEEKVDETTTSGSVATAPAASKSSKGMQFGKGVYENLDAKLETMIAEGMNVTVNMNSDAEGKAQKSITVTATGDDADKLAELLKMAGLESKQEVCPSCGSADCQCEEEMVDENSPDWPTNTEKIDAQPELRTYSGGLNGPKSTGQTTIPVIASQARRQGMEENVELERSLFKTWSNYKG